MEHPYRNLAVLGAGIAAAAWAAIKAAQRNNPSPYRVEPRPQPRPRQPNVPPVVRPTTPTRTPGPVVRPKQPISPELTERRAVGQQLITDLQTPVVATKVQIARLTEKLAADLGSQGRPGESLTQTTMRLYRELNNEAQRRFPGANLVNQTGARAWDAVFLAAPIGGDGLIQLAPWTQKRQTNAVGAGSVYSDELLLRTSVAMTVVRGGAKATPLAGVMELWRCGVVPDIDGDRIVCRRDGVVIAEAGPKPPQAERGVA